MNRYLRIISILCVLCFVSVAVAENTSQSQAKPIQVVKNGLEKALSQQIYCKVQCNESGIIVWMADEGTADTLTSLFAAGYDETNDSWVEFKNKIIGLYNSIHEFAIANGIENPDILYTLVDDINFETVLLAVYNGEIIFDIMQTSDAITAIKDIYHVKADELTSVKEITVPVGKYTIGSDIPANTYTIKHAGSVISMITVYSENGGILTYYTVSPSAPVGKCELKDGQSIEIIGEPVILTQYKGLEF